MRKSTSTLLAALLALGGTQLAYAAPLSVAAGVDAKVNAGVQTDLDKSQGTVNMSEEATINANSPDVGQEKGQDRATERKAIDHTNKGKHKGQEKPATDSGS